LSDQHTRPSDIKFVYATFPDEAAAETVGSELVSSGLAACVNILGAITSIYIWDGRLCREREIAVIAKTRSELADAVVAEIKSRHPYDTPAILILPVSGGSQPFIDWIANATARPGVPSA